MAPSAPYIMISLRTQTTLNLILNVIFAGCLTGTLLMNFFAFLVLFTQDYKVGVLTITHRLKFEDVSGEVYSSFANFEAFACPFSQDPGIVTVCGNLINFMWAGYIYFGLSIFLFVSLATGILNLTMMIFQQTGKLTRFWYPHAVNAGVFVMAAGEFLLVSNVDSLAPPKEIRLVVVSETGIPMLFVTASVAIITLLHYVFLRKYRNLNSMEVATLALVSKFLSKAPEPDMSAAPQGDAAMQGQLVDLHQRLRTANDQIAELTIERDALKQPQGDLPGQHIKQRQAADTGPGEVEIGDDVFQNQDRDLLREELKEMRIRVETLTGQLERANNEKTSFESSLETANSHLKDERKSLTAAQKTIEDLQARIDQLLKEVANVQGVEQVKKLLEDEKMQELERQKTLFGQQIKSRDDDITELRAQLESVKRESVKKDERLQDAENKSYSSDSRRESIETELKDLRDRLRDSESTLQSLKTMKIDLELRVSTAANELNAEREKYKHLDDTHKRALVEMGQATTGQLENLKKMYAENVEREVKVMKDNQASREQKLQSEIAKLRADLTQSQEAFTKLDSETKSKLKTFGDSDAELKRLRSQVESLTARLAHAEADATKRTEEASTANRKARETADELNSLQTRLKAQDDLNAKMLAEQELRHDSEKERLKLFYEEMQAKELNEIKQFYEQKVSKLTSDLISERGQHAEALEAADRAAREKEIAAGDLARINELYLKLKLSVDAEHGSQSLKESQLNDANKEIARLRGEVEALRGSIEQGSDWQHDLNACTLKLAAKENEIEELNKLLEAFRSQNSQAVNQELDRLRELLNRRETDNQELAQKNLTQGETIRKLLAENEGLKATVKDIDARVTERQQAPAPESGSVLAKLEKKRAKLKALREQLSALGPEKEKQLADLVETYRQENERVKDTYMTMFHGQTEDVKKMYESLNNSLKAERDKLREEAENLASKLSESASSLSRLKKDYELLEAERDSEVEIRQKIYRQYQDLKSRYEEKENELADLNRLLDSLRKSGGGKEMAILMETQIKDLSAGKNQLAKDLDVTRKERDDLRSELIQRDTELQALKDEHMQLHKELFDSREKSRPSGGWSRDSKSQESVHSLKETMVIEGLAVKSGPNPILEKIANLRRESPMTYSNVWKLFETLMQEKVKLDHMETRMGRPLRSMTDYMLDFVYMHYGLKTLALKQLKALVMSLQELHKASHPYGTLFSRFLGLFHPRPLPNHLAAFVLVAQEEFYKIAMRSKEYKTESYAETYDVMQYGGQISIIDAMELVVRLSRGNRDAGERIIAQILPADEENRVETTLMKVCGTMARMGKDAQYIFDILDRDRGGFIDYHEFVDGIRLTLNIWVTQDEAEDLCAYINDRGTGDVSREEWARKVDFEAYAEKSQSKERMVTKCDLLTALIDEFEHEVVQDYYHVRNLIKKPVVDARTALELLRKLDPMIEERTANQLYEEARDFDRDSKGGVSPESFCVVILRNRVGGLGVGIFGKPYSDLSGLETHQGRVSEMLPIEGRGSTFESEDVRRSLPVRRLNE